MFIAAMLALSLLMRRPESDDPDVAASDGRQPEELVQSSIPELPPARRDRSSSSSRGSVPVWLQGVSLPGTDASLSASTSVIEALLTARRDHDLAAGLALFTPGTRASLAKQLGIDTVESTEILANAAFEGDSPALRSAEIVEGVGAR